MLAINTHRIDVQGGGDDDALECDVEPPEPDDEVDDVDVDESDAEGQAEQAEPIDIPRPATCMRPPCLKRTNTNTSSTMSPPSNNSPLLGSSPSMAWSPPTSSTRSVSSPTPSTSHVYSSSFTTPRYFSASGAPSSSTHRHVHFDASPPEAFATHSAEEYDRSQIECTQGGSEFDLRLPSKCKRYNGDGEEETSEVEDDEDEDGTRSEGSASSTASSSYAKSPPLGVHGSTGWACLKRGAVIGGLPSRGSLSLTASSSQDGPTSELSSLPSRGLRTVGALSGRGILNTTSAPTSVFSGRGSTDSDTLAGSADDSTASSSTTSDMDEDDGGAAAFEAAVIAASAGKSPDATPKPSPSIVPRWARCTDYFAEPAVDDEGEETLVSAEATASSPAEATRLPSTPHEDALEHTPSAEAEAESSTTPLENTPKMSPSPTGVLSPGAAIDAQSGDSTVTEGTSPAAGAPVSLLPPLEASHDDGSASQPMSRRPSLNRPQAFGSGSGSVSPPLSLGAAALLSTEGLATNNSNTDCGSSASPLSSRCSSVEPSYYNPHTLWSSSSGAETISDEGATTPSSSGSGNEQMDNKLGGGGSPAAVAVEKDGAEWARGGSPVVGSGDTVADVSTTGAQLGGVDGKSPLLHHQEQLHHQDNHAVLSDSDIPAPSSPFNNTVLSKAISRIEMLQRTDSNGSNASSRSASSSHDEGLDEAGAPRKPRSATSSRHASRHPSSSCTAASSTTSSRRPSSSYSSASSSLSLSAFRHTRYWASESDAPMAGGGSPSAPTRSWASIPMETSSSADSAMSATSGTTRSVSASGSGSAGMPSPSPSYDVDVDVDVDVEVSAEHFLRGAGEVEGLPHSSGGEKERERKSRRSKSGSSSSASSSTSRSRSRRKEHSHSHRDEAGMSSSLADDEEEEEAARSYFSSRRQRSTSSSSSAGGGSRRSSSRKASQQAEARAQALAALEDEGALGGF